MLSLLSSKNTYQQQSEPKIIDFNTISKEDKEKNKSKNKKKIQTIKEQQKGFFSFWPFYSSKANDSNTDKEANIGSNINITNPLDEVIAMKKVYTDDLKDNDNDNDKDNGDDNGNGNDNDHEDEDEFIDIQIRKLSYAEVASLLPEKKFKISSKTGPDNYNICNSKHNNDHILVVDQDKELEKSITDVEFVENYKKTKKFGHVDSLTTDELMMEDEDDSHNYYQEKRLPKRFLKNKQHLKSKK